MLGMRHGQCQQGTHWHQEIWLGCCSSHVRHTKEDFVFLAMVRGDGQSRPLPAQGQALQPIVWSNDVPRMPTVLLMPTPPEGSGKQGMCSSSDICLKTLTRGRVLVDALAQTTGTGNGVGG